MPSKISPQSNPNATNSVLVAQLAIILAYVVSMFGVDLPNEVAAAMTGALIGLVLLLGGKRP